MWQFLAIVQGNFGEEQLSGRRGSQPLFCQERADFFMFTVVCRIDECLRFGNIFCPKKWVGVPADTRKILKDNQTKTTTYERYKRFAIDNLIVFPREPDKPRHTTDKNSKREAREQVEEKGINRKRWNQYGRPREMPNQFRWHIDNRQTAVRVQVPGKQQLCNGKQGGNNNYDHIDAPDAVQVPDSTVKALLKRCFFFINGNCAVTTGGEMAIH